MPRSAKDEAMRSLRVALANDEKIARARAASRERLRLAMVRAVVAGNTRHAVAALVGVSPTRIGQIEGMPKGKNAVTRDVE